MANLKSDLDDYLLQNESRRGIKISLPFSGNGVRNMFSRSESETSSGKSSWFAETEKNCCTMSRTNRMIGFAACVCFGILCFILSAFYIPFLLLKARKFALLFTLGSMFFIFSFTFLYGPWTHVKSLFSKERVVSTLTYGSTLIATLYCALHLQSTILTIVFAVLQIMALIWILFGAIPGGASGLKFFGSMFKSSVSNTLPI